jgi:hypothetical protein
MCTCGMRAPANPVCARHLKITFMIAQQEVPPHKPRFRSLHDEWNRTNESLLHPPRGTLPLACPARVPKPSRPGPGRPPRSKRRHPAATRHYVGKKRQTPERLYQRDQSRRHGSSGRLRTYWDPLHCAHPGGDRLRALRDSGLKLNATDSQPTIASSGQRGTR